MKNFSFTFIILLAMLTTAVLHGQGNSLWTRDWPSGSAYILPQGRFELGIFQPLRYGYSDNIEISAYPIYFFVMPNFNVKWSHGKAGRFLWASKHSLYYPTPALRLVAKEGIGGLISPEFNIPHMVELYNELIISLKLSESMLLTGNAGLSLTAVFGHLDKNSSIDLPMIYPRLAVFYNGYGFRLGLNFEDRFHEKFKYSMDADIFYAPGFDQNFAFEHKGLVYWYLGKKTEFCLGYKLVYSEYPFGTQWHLFLPLLDFQFVLK